MFYTTRHFFPHGIEGEEMDCTFKQFDTLEKAIAYAHRYSKGVRFASCMIEDEEGNLVYELLSNGVITDNRKLYQQNNEAENKNDSSEKNYLVEFAFSENFTSVQEWQTMDGLECIEAENAEEAAKTAACTDGLDNALFRVFLLIPDQFGKLEIHGEPQFFCF